MSRLNRKCFLASATLHGLLFLILLVGPAFFISREKAEDLPTLDFIPAKLIDEPFHQASAPPQQTPAQRPRTTARPPAEPARPTPVKPPEPKPVETTPEPKPEPTYTKAENIKVNLKPKASRTPSKPVQPAPQPRLDTADAARAIRTTTATPVNVPAMSSASREAYANYGQAVKSIYERSWYPPEQTASDDALVKVEIVIARDGSILSARIIGRSGDVPVDSSVEATLRRVTKVPAFPAGATEAKRTYTIGFNLKARRALG